MQAHELRYLMVHHMRNDCIEQPADALACQEAWKAGECAYVHCTVQRPDGHCVRYAGSPIGTTDMALWIGALTEKPAHLHEINYDLSITTLDDLLS